MQCEGRSARCGVESRAQSRSGCDLFDRQSPCDRAVCRIWEGFRKQWPAILSLVTLYATTQTETTRAKSRQVLVMSLSSYIMAKSGGWEVLEQLRLAVERQVLHPQLWEGSESAMSASGSLSPSTRSLNGSVESLGSSASNTSNPHLLSADLFEAMLNPLLKEILQFLLSQSSLSVSKSKQKDPTTQIMFEKLALSSYWMMCYALDLLPDPHRTVVQHSDNSIVSTQRGDIPEVNQLPRERAEILQHALEIWKDLAGQLSSPTDSCGVDNSKTLNVPILEKGVLPILIRGVEAMCIFQMRVLFENGSTVREVKNPLFANIATLETALQSTGVFGKNSEIDQPKSDWVSQLLLNAAHALFALIGVCTRIESMLTMQPGSAGKALLSVWTEIAERLWSLFGTCIRNVAPLLITLDEPTFGVLQSIRSVKPQNLLTFNSWVPLLSNRMFVNAVDGMKRMLLAYRAQYGQIADTRCVEMEQRSIRCASETSPLSARLAEEMGETIVASVEAFEKEATFSIIERETNGLKIMKKLWRELVLGPSMWHGVEGDEGDESRRVYYQLDCKETEKRLRNRLKRDWNERPHRHIGRDLTGKKKAATEEKNELMTLNLYRKGRV